MTTGMIPTSVSTRTSNSRSVKISSSIRRPIHRYSIVTPNLLEHKEKVRCLLRGSQRERRKRITRKASSFASPIEEEAGMVNAGLSGAGVVASSPSVNPINFQGARSVIHQFRQKDQWDRMTVRNNRRQLLTKLTPKMNLTQFESTVNKQQS